MTRWIVLFACAFAFAVAAPMGFQAEARKAKYKVCTEATMSGKKVTWRCKASQECCYNWFMSKPACCGMGM